MEVNCEQSAKKVIRLSQKTLKLARDLRDPTKDNSELDSVMRKMEMKLTEVKPRSFWRNRKNKLHDHELCDMNRLLIKTLVNQQELLDSFLKCKKIIHYTDDKGSFLSGDLPSASLESSSTSSSTSTN